MKTSLFQGPWADRFRKPARSTLSLPIRADERPGLRSVVSRMSSTNPTEPVVGRPAHRWARAVVAGVAGLGVLWLVHRPLERWVMLRAVLGNDAPTADAVEAVVANASDPGRVIGQLWDTGRVVHRELAVRQLARFSRLGEDLPTGLERVLTAAAGDADLSVRETAFGLMIARRDPRLVELATHQLADVDPEVRLLALDGLRRAPFGEGMPAILPRLADSDPRVVARAVKLAEGWSGEDFGVKLADTVPTVDDRTGRTTFHDEGLRKARDGAERVRAWWNSQSPGGLAGRVESEGPERPGSERIVVDDFALPGLDGRTTRFADLRGRVVIVNFWTTWCPSCRAEMPALNELQKRWGERLAVLGVSLDLVPDEHGHVGGEEAHGGPEVRREQIVERVARAVEKLGLGYRVLLDERGAVSRRFSGGELPTTLVIGPDGTLWRRFVGPRSREVFDAMIGEADAPTHNLPRSD